MAVISVSSTSELLAAVSNAKGGDIIELASGNYGSVDFDNLSFSDYVTITSADGNQGAVFSEISVSDVSFLHIDGVEVNHGSTSGSSRGIDVQDSDHVKITNNYVHDVNVGYVALSSNNVEFSNNTVDRVGADGFKFSGLTDFLIENNEHLGTTFQDGGAHMDFIQFVGSSSDGVIRGNVMLVENAVNVQGIYLDNGSYSDILIEQNIIYTGLTRGISVTDRFGNASGIVIQNNTVLNTPDDGSKTSIISAPSGSVVKDNIQTTLAGSQYLGNDGSGGIRLQHDNPNASFYYDDYFVNATDGAGLTLEDLRPVEGSAAESVGAYARLLELLNEGGGGGGSGDPGNTRPEAVDDDISTDEDASVTVTPETLLANDTDADGDDLTIESFSQGSNGTVTVTADGSLIYTPDAQFFGTDQFTYTVNDGSGGRSTATVNVTVAPQQDSPTAVDDIVTVRPGESTVLDVLGNDVDPDADTINIVGFTDAGNGEVTQNSPLTYTPDDGFVGTDQFTYTISDGKGGTDTATVTVRVVEFPAPVLSIGENEFNGSVNSAVVLADDDAYDLPEGTLEIGFNVDTLVDRQGLFSKDATGNGDGGHLAVLIEGDDVRVRLQSETGTHELRVNNVIEAGRDHHLSLTFGSGGMKLYLDGDLIGSNGYTGGLQANSEPIVIGANQWSSQERTADVITDPLDGTISKINLYDAALTPQEVQQLANAGGGVIAGDDSLDTQEGQAITVASSQLLSNDSDADGDPLTILSVNNGANGTAVLNADGSVTYTPDSNFSGQDTFTYVVSDNKGGLDTATVTVNVTSAPPPPPEFTEGADTAVLPATGGTFDALGGDDHISYRGGFAEIDGGAGSDTVDFSNFGSAVWFDLQYSGREVWTRDSSDLNSGSWREIADLTNVEHVVGTVHDDKLRGDANDNTFGYTGGYDAIDGRGGTDTADFSAFGSAVWVSLGRAGSEAWTRGGDDLNSGSWRSIADLTDVENITGSVHDDKLYGDDNDNTLSGDAGDDILEGKGGNDVIDGGAGTDTAVFSSTLSAYSFSLVGTDILVSGFNDGTDTVRNTVENFKFSDTTISRADLLASIAQPDFTQNDDVVQLPTSGGTFDALGGDDHISYRGGFAEIDGGAGSDTVDFSNFGSAVWFDLQYSGREVWTRDSSDLSSGSWREIADLANVEHVVGTVHDDKLRGDANDNTFGYTGGYDTIDGRGGTDTADFSAFGSAVWVNLGRSGKQAWTRDGEDLSGGSWRSIADLTDVENVTGSVHDDKLYGDDSDNTLSGDAGDDILEGNGGNDIIDGGAGTDTAVFSSTLSAYNFSVVGTDILVSGFNEGTDTVRNTVENFKFSDTTISRADLLASITTSNVSAAVNDPLSPSPVASPVLDVFDNGSSANGNTLTFDGTVDSAIVLAHDSQYELAQGTLEIAFNADALTTGRQGIFSKDASYYGTGGHLSAWLENDDFVVRLQSSNGDYYVRAENVLNAGQDHHMALTFGSDGMKLYLDGALMDSNSYTGGLQGNKEPIAIGAHEMFSGDESADILRDAFDGTVSTVKLYGEALSQQDIQQLASDNAGVPQLQGAANSSTGTAWQSAFGDTDNEFDWSEYTNFYDESGNLYQQTGTYDDGRTWQMLWDMDDSESWAEQFTVYDSAGLYNWSEQVSEYDDNGQLISTTVVDDGLI